MCYLHPSHDTYTQFRQRTGHGESDDLGSEDNSDTQEVVDKMELAVEEELEGTDVSDTQSDNAPRPRLIQMSGLHCSCRLMDFAGMFPGTL